MSWRSRCLEQINATKSIPMHSHIYIYIYLCWSMLIRSDKEWKLLLTYGVYDWNLEWETLANLESHLPIFTYQLLAKYFSAALCQYFTFQLIQITHLSMFMSLQNFLCMPVWYLNICLQKSINIVFVIDDLINCSTHQMFTSCSGHNNV